MLNLPCVEAVRLNRRNFVKVGQTEALIPARTGADETPMLAIGVGRVRFFFCCFFFLKGCC